MFCIISIIISLPLKLHNVILQNARTENQTRNILYELIMQTDKQSLSVQELPQNGNITSIIMFIRQNKQQLHIKTYNAMHSIFHDSD